MSRSRFTAAALLFLACTPAASTGTAADEQAIRDGASAWATAWNNHDAKAMGAMVADDYQSFDGRGNPVQGRQAFEDAMTAEFTGSPAGTRLTLTTGFVEWLGATGATAGGDWSLRGEGAGLPASGAWLFAYRKVGSTWLIVSGLGNITPPSSPMASDTAHTDHP